MVDLDALVTKPIPFRFGGEIHFVKPLDTAAYFTIVNEVAHLDTLRGTNSGRDLVEGYIRLFAAACDTITPEMVWGMSQPQCIALLNLIMDAVTGRAHADIEKKKAEILLLRDASAPPH